MTTKVEYYLAPGTRERPKLRFHAERGNEEWVLG
jgi:hypothetical protein